MGGYASRNKPSEGTDLDLQAAKGSGIDRAMSVMGDDYKQDVERTIRAKT